MKLKRSLSLLLALCMVLGLAACGKAASPAAEPAAEESSAAGVSVNDLIGRELEIVPGSYKRVVCIGAGALRIFSYICDVRLLCGVEDIDNPTLENRPKMFDSSARPYILALGSMFSSLPSCGIGGPNAQAAEAEKILSCRPDIVISQYEDVEKADALQEQLGVPVVTLRSGPAGVFAPEFLESIRLVGEVFDCGSRAEALISLIEDQIAELSERTADIPEEEKPGVYICGLGNWGTTDHLMTSENYAAFAAANIRNVVQGLGMKGIGAIEEEKFVSLGSGMDIMFIDAAAVKNITPLYAEDSSLFDTCKAWQTGEVYLEMPYNVYYTNYELALANAWFIAKTVYPERFEDVDMTEKLNEITCIFLGRQLADEIFACPTSFGGYQKIDTATFFG